MQKTIEIVQDHPGLSVDEGRLLRLIESVAAQEQSAIARLTVVLTDHETVLALNRTYLDHDYQTDVLAFSLAEDDEIDGEIYVDLDTATERCEEFGATFDHEASRYVLHGLLHILGYRDKDEAERSVMKQREDEYLERFLIAK